MSDTEDGSDVADDTEEGTDGAGADDDFDKEAEREKLREQYEHDQKRREATEHMSDLLLKGATMTNTHCDDCGSPIFRYDGEAFCPTCAGTREMVDDGTSGQDGEDEGGAQPRQGGTGRASGGTGREDVTGTSTPDQSGETPTGPDGGDRPAGSAAGESEDIDLEEARSRLDERAAGRSPDVGGETDRGSNPPRTGDSPVRQGEVPSMAQTRASLRRAIVSLSEQAAQSDDPGRAHDLLKGAHEASEALAALEGAKGE